MNKIHVLLVLGLLGGLLKIIGGVFYGSRSLLVDALTSFANIASLVAIIYFHELSTYPPDSDHPYGHYRLGFGGVLVSLIAYGYVAGIASTTVIYSREYIVDFNAAYYAFLGLTVYSVAVYLALRMGGVFKTYGLFTVSELYESIVTSIAATMGALYTYIIDYVGAVGLTLYIFYELVSIGRDTFNTLIDRAAPTPVINRVIELFEKEGFKVLSVRIRQVAPGVFHGDVRVEVKDLRRDSVKLEVLKERIRRELNIDLAIEPFINR